MYLLVTAKGSKLWRLDYRFKRKRRTLALGKYPVVKLKTARAERDRAFNRTSHLPARRAMMQSWADYLDELRTGSGKVVRIGKVHTG